MNGYRNKNPSSIRSRIKRQSPYAETAYRFKGLAAFESDMSKSIYSDQYRAMLKLLREARVEKDIKQTDLTKRLNLDQSSISRIETGDRRLDVIELRNYCIAIGISFTEFVTRLEINIS